ncbi:MAG: hypothetical protein AAF696_16710 [Bacteroidota bacterium]
MRKVWVDTYKQNPHRYKLRKGTAEGAPSCPYGNSYQWIGYDKEENEYVRFSKRLFKHLIRLV